MANTQTPPGRGNGWLERAAWHIAVALIAVSLTCVQLTVTPPYKLTSFQRMVHFNTFEPFQHRVLVPAIVAGLQQVVAAGDKLLFGAVEIIAWFALIELAYRALVIFSVGRSDLIRRLLAFSVVIPMCVHLMVPELYIQHIFVIGPDGLALGGWKPLPIFYYVYDLPSAAFALAMVLMLTRQLERPSRLGFAAYLVLFAMATVNRETTAFLISFFALLFWARMPWPRWLGLILLQGVLFAAIQLPLYWIFRHHPNPSPDAGLAHSQYENHLLENLGLLANPVYLMVFLVRFMAGLYIPVLLWWRDLDWRLIRVLLGFALPLIVAALSGGRLQEHRIFIGAVPLIWIAAMQVIARSSAKAAAVEDSPASAAVATAGNSTQPSAVPAGTAAAEPYRADRPQ